MKRHGCAHVCGRGRERGNRNCGTLSSWAFDLYWAFRGGGPHSRLEFRPVYSIFGPIGLGYPRVSFELGIIWAVLTIQCHERYS